MTVSHIISQTQYVYNPTGLKFKWTLKHNADRLLQEDIGLG